MCVRAVEEKFLKGYRVPALLAVGLEVSAAIHPHLLSPLRRMAVLLL